jgi:hypothetical protein
MRAVPRISYCFENISGHDRFMKIRVAVIRRPTLRMVRARRARLGALACQLAATRRAGAATEFALCGLGLFAFIMAVVNMGLLGLSLGALQRGVQASARQAAVNAAASYAASSSATFTCPSTATINNYFNGFANPPLPPVGSSNGPTLAISWVNNSSDSTATEPPGVYITLTATYNWVPLGFGELGPSISLKLSTLAEVTGTTVSGASFTSC